MKLEEMREIAEKRVKGKYSLDSGYLLRQVDVDSLNRPVHEAVDTFEMENFINFCANNFDKLLAVVEAAKRLGCRIEERFSEAEGKWVLYRSWNNIEELRAALEDLDKE